MNKPILLLALLGLGAGANPAAAESYAASTDLSLTFDTATTSPLPGSNIVVELTIHNDGTFAAEEAIVSLDLPFGVAFLSATAVSGSYDSINHEWSTGTVDSFSSQLLTLNLMVDPSSPASLEIIADLLSFTGAFDSYDYDSTPGNANPCEDDYASLTLYPAGVPAPDAGIGPDAGSLCPGPADAGPGGNGGGHDGGDGVGLDAGPGEMGGSGGGCQLVGSSEPGWPLLLLAFGIALSRRRRRAKS